uniref:ATP synthase CF0 subunit I n=1 Tax=Lympha mucosa TaxID=2045360 RepID=A0A6B9VSW3_9FLOR|nr:ATP synthase CF0 subunit I [Lympha mucosa]
MDNFISLLYFLTKSYETEIKTFGFNTNFLEANVINITLLLLGLIYILKNFLGSTLIGRQQKVLTAIQESEKRLQEASIRLEEAEKQLAQTQMIVTQITDDAKQTAKKVREAILGQGKLDIEKLTVAGKNSIANAEQQIKKQIQKQITALAIQRVTLQLKTKIKPEMQSRIIDTNIMQLKYKL